jgi:hypothetical protein
VLRRISGPKHDEIIMRLQKLHSEELYNIYSSPNIIGITRIKSRRMRWAGRVPCVRAKRSVYKVSGRKIRRKDQLGRPNCRCKDKIKMNFIEIGWVYGLDSSASG